MWLLAPLIFILAWVKSHNIGQSITESAAWCGGYMAAAGIIIALNMGSIHIISEAPDGPGSILPILGGFLFMWVSHMLWKRRGGHLQRREVPLSRLAGRAYIAFRGNDPAKPATTLNHYAKVAKHAAGAVQTRATRRPVTKPRTSMRQTSAPTRNTPQSPPQTSSPAGRSTTHAQSPATRPPAPKKPAITRKAPAASKAKIVGRLAAGASQQMAQSDTAQKAMTNRWLRGSVKAMGAIVNDPKKRSKPTK